MPKLEQDLINAKSDKQKSLKEQYVADEIEEEIYGLETTKKEYL